MARVTGGIRFGRGFALALGAMVATGCAGENLFGLPGSVGDQSGAPVVEITAPAEGAGVVLGDSVLVSAEVTAANGGGAIVYRGSYADGTDAFVPEFGNMNGVAASTLTNYLRAAGGQTAGSAYIVVEVTGLGGGLGKDSVQITLN